MKKLILIGNGFNLAHKINTSYNQFIEAYFKKIYWKSLNPNRYSDDLIEVLASYPLSPINPIENNKITYTALFYRNQDNFNIKSNFFRVLLETQKLRNWVDIEDILFNELFKLIDIERRKINTEGVTRLNQDFEFLKNKLIEYLNEITEDLDIKPDPRYLKKFLDGIENLNQDYMIFVNFNYTNTIQTYITKCYEIFENVIDSKKLSTRIRRINIHGNLKEPNNTPIFGIGDEHHDKYKAKKTLMIFILFYGIANHFGINVIIII